MRFQSFFGARTVLVAGPLTFKFPRLKLAALVDDCRQADPILLSLTFRGFYESLLENIREAAWSFRANRPVFLVPCILPLVAVNVYPTVDGVGRLKIGEKWEELWLAASGEFRRLLCTGGCSHTFKYDKNFAIENDGRIRMLDYGGPSVSEILERYPDEVERLLEAAR